MRYIFTFCYGSICVKEEKVITIKAISYEQAFWLFFEQQHGEIFLKSIEFNNKLS